ncbi:hypothetical protein [Sphingomonas sp. GV3]|uniref:hypothetical protein n=1 Tax=Sphingomonas sp. GV3 TaxID=3040671 RepID=UPI00280B598E|nr:hypothetical protein [Sphingomonas sp. GV3]
MIKRSFLAAAALVAIAGATEGHSQGVPPTKAHRPDRADAPGMRSATATDAAVRG